MVGKGFFVCIEGLDKSGKTTQARLLVSSLRRRGYDAFYTTEPSRGEIGHFIRSQILRRRKRVPAVVEAILFAADRIDHIEREIKPLLREKKIVISDRYVYSSLAYQGATGLNTEWIMEINKLAPTPDLAIFIDVSPEILYKRIRGDRSVMERLWIQRKVREIYMKLIREGKMVLINGNRPVRKVSKDILTLTLNRLDKLECV